MSTKAVPKETANGLFEIYGTMYTNVGCCCVAMGIDGIMYRYSYPPKTFYAELSEGTVVKIYFEKDGMDPKVSTIEAA